MLIQTVSIFECAWCSHRLPNAPTASTHDYTYRTCANTFHYYLCSNCQSLTLGNRPVESTLGLIYPSNYLTYDYKKQLGLSYVLKLLYNTFKSRLLVGKVFGNRKNMPDLSPATTNISILDVGCGGGDFIAALKKAVTHGTNLKCAATGVDIVAPITDKLDICIEADISVFDLSPNAYHIITCFQVLEHVANPRDVLRKLVSSLRPGGALVIETPYYGSVDRIVFPNRMWSGWHAPRHWCILSPSGLFAYVGCSNDLSIDMCFTPCPYMWITNIRHSLGIDESTPLQSIISVSNPLLVVFFTLIDYLLISLRLPTSNVQYCIRKSS